MLLSFHLCSKWSWFFWISVSQQKTLWRKGGFSPSSLTAGTGASVLPSPHTGVYAVSFPGSQTLACRLPYTADFPASPACTWQTLGLSLHNHVRRFLIVNQSLSLSFSSLTLNSFWFCFSGKPWLIQGSIWCLTLFKTSWKCPYSIRWCWQELGVS